MKRISLFVLAIVVLPVLADAQTITVGAKGGLNLSWFSGNNWDDYIEFVEWYYGITIDERPRASFVGGPYLEAMFAENVGVVFEASYAVYGQRYEYTAMGMDFDGQYWQRAVQLPLLLKLAAGRSGGIYAVVGPTVSFLIGDFEFEESGGGISVSDSVKPDNPAVLGFLAGAGYEVPLGDGELSFELRYGRNLTDAFEEDAFDTNTFQGLIGYGFHVQ
ncbi:MAG: porin family protein [Spirochaetia bacterium]